MPFFRRFANGQLSPDSTSTQTLIKDATLTQTDAFWNGHWFYGITGEDMSIIRSFSNAGHSFIPEIGIAASSNTEEPYEIHSLWNAAEIHNAINRAIDIAKRIFTDTVRDASMILEQDKLSYTISGLTKVPFAVHKVWLENPASIYRGQASAGGASTITVQSVPSDITTNWKISIYDKTGKGQIRNYVSAVGLVVTVDSAWTTQPDSTSKYAIWDASEELYDWIPLDTWYTDAPEFPDTINFRSRMASYYGVRIRIEYESLPTALTTDASTTIVPKEYIVSKACSILHGQKLNDTKVDQQSHYAENQRYSEDADKYLINNAPHIPASTIKSHEQRTYIEDEDPLGWNR